MKTALTLLFFLIVNLLIAQNFQNLCSPGTTLFQRNDGYFEAFRRDSVIPQGNGDTLFLSYRAIRDSSQYDFICRDTTNGDALGRRIIKRHDGWFWFFNLKNDTIRINTQANLNDSWEFCAISDCTYIQATVTDITTDSVLGTIDPVKVISLQTKNQLGNNIPGIFNQKTILLSKNHGLSELYDLYLAPADTARLVLIGKTDPPSGPQPFGWREVYDFNVGDEFHYQGHQFYNGSSTVYWKSINRILGKTIYGNLDSVHYQVETCKKTWYPVPPPNTATLHDTIVESHDFIQLAGDKTIGLLPGEFNPFGYGAASASRKYSWFNNRQAQIVNSNGYFWDQADSCYNDPFEVWGPICTYVPGLGLTDYLYEIADMGLSGYYNDLVYFKKGSEIWGTPVATDCSSLITAAPEITAAPSPDVFPNPARDAVTVRIGSVTQGEPVAFTLYSFAGAIALEGVSTVNPFIIQRGNLPAGLYILRITDLRGRMFGVSKIGFE